MEKHDMILKAVTNLCNNRNIDDPDIFQDLYVAGIENWDFRSGNITYASMYNHLVHVLDSILKRREEYYSTVLSINDNKISGFLNKTVYIIDENVENNIFMQDFVSKILDMLNKDEYISSRDIEIFIKRFGLNNNDTKVLTELANEYDLCQERVRQIECRIMRYLRKKKDISNLRIFFRG